jgi:antitoxin YefM
MYSIYRMKSSELDTKFVESLKALFRGQEIEIVVSQVSEEETSEANYESDRRTILEAIETIEAGSGRFL